MLGLRRAGIAAVEALVRRFGPEAVHVWDDSPDARARLSIAGVRLLEQERGLQGIGLVVKSPGVEPSHPLLLEARRVGAAVLDELELGWRLGSPPLLAVTGTNGKSTTAALLAEVLRAGGAEASLAGNVESIQGGPLSALKSAGRGWVVAEVSSYQAEFLLEMRARAAIFTNLTPDHLQRHGTMEAYGAAKRRLFVNDAGAVQLAVLNVDDPFGRTLERDVRALGGRTLTYGVAEDAGYRIEGCESYAGGSRLALRTPRGPIELATRMPGLHNAANTVAVLALADGLGLAREPALAALAGASLPPGRMERVDAGQPFEVFVDFAHSPDSLDRALAALRSITSARGGRLIAVVGLAPTGERRTREECGRVARAGCDHLVLSAWSLRGEPPLVSLAWVLAGARSRQGAALEVLARRRAAIARAFSLAGPRDVVAILGRGPIGRIALDERGGAIAFDDRAVARELLG